MTTDFDKLSRTDIARIFRVSPRSIGHWVSQGCPVNRDGSLSCQNVYAWRLSRAKRTGYLQTQQAMLARARAELMEMDVSERRAELLPAGEALRMVLLLGTAIRDELRKLPDSITAAVLKAGPQTYAQTRQLLAEMIDDKLREISTPEFVRSLKAKP